MLAENGGSGSGGSATEEVSSEGCIFSWEHERFAHIYLHRFFSMKKRQNKLEKALSSYVVILLFQISSFQTFELNITRYSFLIFEPCHDFLFKSLSLVVGFSSCHQVFQAARLRLHRKSIVFLATISSYGLRYVADAELDETCIFL